MKKFAIVLLSLILPAYIFAANAVVMNVKGNAQYLKLEETNWAPVTKGLFLTENDEIKTGADGFISLVLDTGSKIDISGLTEVKIAKLTDTDTLLDITMGELEARVEKMKKNMSFKVKTPAAVCAVRGTRFKIVVERNGRMRVTVFAGIVSAREISGIGEEIYIRQNQYLDVLPGVAPSSAVDLSFVPTVREVLLTKAEVMNEVRMDMTKEQVQASAAIEIKNAEYEQGKTMVDYFGKRVRIEEYIVRPQPDQFKFVALNERDNRFDYFTWLATFNTDLPADLSVANKIAFEKTDKQFWSNEPLYWIKQHDSAASNTVDSVSWAKKRTNWDQVASVTDWTINAGGTEHTVMKDGQQLISFTYNSNESINNNAHDSYTSDLPGNYKEDYYFIDDDGVLASKTDYLSNPLGYNEEFVFSSDNFKGVDGKIDIVVEPKIFEQAGIR